MISLAMRSEKVPSGVFFGKARVDRRQGIDRFVARGRRVKADGKVVGTCCCGHVSTPVDPCGQAIRRPSAIGRNLRTRSLAV